jgi:hypothetical protein
MGEKPTNPIQLKLKVEQNSGTDEQLEDSTRNLANELREIQGIDNIAYVPGEKIPEGARAGEIVSLGEIILTFISSGAMVAAIGAINSWISGRTGHKVKIELKDGSKVIDGQGLTKEEVQRLIDLAK